MSESFEIASARGGYKVEIARGLFKGALGDSNAIVICDDRFEPQARAAGARFVSLKAGESTKSLDAMSGVIERLRDMGANRKTHLIAVGGGVVQDVATFVAGVYMRGLSWTYLPTTLLGMADSCIGGKSSINVGKYKNLVGSFHPPVAVLVDPEFLEGLPPLQRAAGLCEAGKICFVRGPAPFAAYLDAAPSTETSIAGFQRILVLSLRTKKWFIEIDEFDQAERQMLNFGHTFGHALEGASNFGISHGLAVGLGMVAAIHFGRASGFDYARSPHVAALRAHVGDLLEAAPELGALLAGVSVAEAMRCFESDKKHETDRYAVIVPNGQGIVERLMLPKGPEIRDRVEYALTATIQEFI